MKKSVKNVLFGTGIAAIGLVVYSLWKNMKEPVAVRNADAKSAVTSSKEFVEHRRQQVRDAAEARKAAQKEYAQEEAIQKGPAQEEAIQKGPAQEEAAQEKVVQEEPAQKEALDTVPVDPVPSEQTVEKLGELGERL